MTDPVIFKPENRDWTSRIPLELIWISFLFMGSMLVISGHLWPINGFNRILYVLFATILWLIRVIYSPYNGWLQRRGTSHFLHLYPDRVGHARGNASRMVDFADVTSATFYYDTASRIGQIQLRHRLGNATIQNWQDMNRVARHVTNFLPDKVVKHNRVLTGKPNLIRSLVWVVGAVGLSFVFMLPLRYTVLPATTLGACIEYWRRINVLPKHKARPLVSGAFWLGLTLLFLADHAGEVGYPCALWQRFVGEVNCTAEYETDDNIRFLPDGTVVVNNLRRLEIRPDGFGWPWEYERVLEHDDFTDGFDYASEDNRLISWADKDVYVWDVATQALLGRHRILSDNSYYNADGFLSPNGKWLAFPQPREATLWSVEDWEQADWLEPDTPAMVFSPSSDFLITAQDDVILFHQLPGGEVFRTITVIEGEQVRSLVISDDGRWLVVATGARRALYILDLPAGTHKLIEANDLFGSVAALSYDGTYLVTTMLGENNPYLQVWQSTAEGYVALSRVETPESRSVQKLYFLEGEPREFVVVVYDEAVRLRLAD